MAGMPSPVASIIIIGYRASATIERAMRSVLAQSFENFELIVVDDGSDDDTLAVVEDFAGASADPRIVVAPPAPNGGPSAARNRGLSLAHGEWVGFLDSDDEYRPDFLRTMLSAATRAAEIDLVVAAHEIVQADGSRRLRVPAVGVVTVSGADAALLTLEDKLTPYVWDKLFRRAIIGVAPFPTSIHRAEDAIVVLTACLAARRVSVIDAAVHIYFVSPASLTWGRVAPLEESDRLMSAMRDASAPLASDPRARRALDVSTALTYLNSAHQGIARFSREESIRFARESANRITWDNVFRALRGRPFVGAAALLLKVCPRGYRVAYSHYIRRAYSLVD